MDHQGVASGPEASARRTGHIADAVATLRDWPHVEQVKSLTGKSGYRLRVGRYRVLFTVHAGIPLVIRIEEVKKRDEHTY